MTQAVGIVRPTCAFSWDRSVGSAVRAVGEARGQLGGGLAAGRLTWLLESAVGWSSAPMPGEDFVSPGDNGVDES